MKATGEPRQHVAAGDHGRGLPGRVFAPKPAYFHAQFHRIARRRGRNKAATAVAHSILVAIYRILKTGQPYWELGVDYFDKLNATRIERHHVHRREQLGYTVTLTPIAA
jgi:transposase